MKGLIMQRVVESRVVSQAEARRIAKAWHARLPTGNRVLWRGETRSMADFTGGYHRLSRNDLHQWVLERVTEPGVK